MSAKVPICLLVGFLLAIPAISQEPTEYLSVIDIKEIEDDRGHVDFVIVVQNTHPYLSFDTISVSVSLKKDGVVVGYMDGHCSGLGVDKICDHTFSSRYTKDDYDTAEGRVIHANVSRNEPDKWLLTGELSLVQESLNIISGWDGDGVAILGELYNGTNAVLKVEKFVLGLWDAEDNFLGLASGGYNKIGTVWPGERAAFIVANSSIPFAQVEKFKEDVEYVIVRYVEDDIATSVDAASWGDIKAMGRR